jgi:photosystem II stability/assembly factor-like uncharacterized protein
MPETEVIYVGTAGGLAIYRPAGRGAWRRAGHVLGGAAVRAIVAADAEALLIAADGRPPLQSFDGGASWGDAAGPAPEPVGLRVATARGPQPLANPRLMGATAYARLSGKPGVLLGAGAGGMLLFRSEDDGIHWRPVGVADGPAGNITTIVPSAGASEAAWAGSDSGALLRTGDRGQSWRVVAREPAAVLCLASVLADK